MTKLDKVIRIAHKCRNLRDATRLWNIIDHQDEPEVLWDAMRVFCPWAFADITNRNSIIFTY